MLPVFGRKGELTWLTPGFDEYCVGKRPGGCNINTTPQLPQLETIAMGWRGHGRLWWARARICQLRMKLDCLSLYSQTPESLRGCSVV